MLNITDEQKRLFYVSGNFKDYVFTFPDIDFEITNETIHQEAVTIKESICEGEEFTLGGCIASSIQFEVSEIVNVDLSGLKFAAEMKANLRDDGSCDLSIPMGVYRVDSAHRVDDKDYKQVTAYDSLYDATVDVSKWYNDLFPVIGTENIPSTDEEGNDITVIKNVYGTTTVKEMRESLLSHLGIPFISQNLPNDGMTVSKTLEPSEGTLSGDTVLKSLCTVNGGFGRMNRNGKFEVIHLKGLGLFPEDSKSAEENVYPDETLYPEDSFEYLGVSSEEDECPEYRNTTYEEYMTHPITCLTIQTDEEDTGTTIGGDTTNPYVITSNFLLYGKPSEELKAAGQNIFNQIKGITYRPNTTTLNGLPYLECGDIFALSKRTDAVESYILDRTLTGIQALVDTYEAKGAEIRTNEVSQSEEILQIKGRILKIIKQSDRFSISLSALEDDAESILDMTATNILLQVQKDGRVVAMTLDGSGKETSFSVEADNINFNGKTFNLSSEDIDIQSAYFSVDKDGKVTAKAIEITGGSINFFTSLDGESNIILKNAIYEGAYNGDIRYTGVGSPNNTPKDMWAKEGDFYFDRSSNGLYRCNENSNGGLEWSYVTIIQDESLIPPSPMTRFYGFGTPQETPEEMDARPGENYINLEDGRYYQCYINGGNLDWIDTQNGDKSKIDHWTETVLNTEDGFSSLKYYYNRYDPSTTEEYKDSTGYAVTSNGFLSEKTTHAYEDGTVNEYQLESHMEIDDMIYEGKHIPIMRANTPFYSTNVKSGSIVKNITTINTRFTVNVSLNMQKTPSVVATPITTNPAAVSVSVADVTETGFTIYMHRTDTTGNLQVNWIAMC